MNKTPVEVHAAAVVGGGIAGAAACLGLLRHGVTPLWFAPPETGEKPGEHLAPAAHTILDRLDAACLLDRLCHRQANSVLSAWGSPQLAERNAIVHLEGPGTVLDRRVFERDLTALALRRGAQAIEAKAEVEQLDINGENVWRLTTHDEAHNARFVIDATGRAAVIATRHAPRFRADQLAALVAFLDQDAASDVEPTRATLIESVPDGWWYAALLADGRLVLNYYTDPDFLPKNTSRGMAPIQTLLSQTEYVGRWIEDAGFQFNTPPRLVSAGTIWTAPAAGPGWIAVGDAAAAFDPLSSHGMTTALWTATSAAEAVPAALAGNDGPLRTYVEKVAEGVQDFLQSRTAIYAMEQRFVDRPFWTRRTPPVDVDPKATDAART